MKKRITALLLILCMCLSLSAAAFADAAAGLANPVHTAEDYEELIKAQPDIKINDAPEDAKNVRYSWIDSDPVISQIDFQLDEREYTYRAALIPEDEENAADISGVYTDFPKVAAHKVENENELGGNVVLQFNASSGEGMINWEVEALDCQYSLYTSTGCTGKVDKMPIIELLDQLYLCTEGAESVKGTVLSLNDTRLIVSLENGDTVVLLRSDIEELAASVNDVVEILYAGDLNGDASVLKLAKVGTAEEGDTATFSGRVFRYAEPNLYIATADNNAFLFITDSSTVVSGKSSVLEQNAEVTITYSGDLYNRPTAVSVNVTKAGVKATPKPSAAPKKDYVERSVSGYITSISFPYITVSGVMFYIDTNVCAIYGDPTTSNQATVNYRDYGYGNVQATAISFYSQKSDYDLRSADGMVYGYSGLGGTLNIEFIEYSVPYDCYIIGSYAPECYADIRYNAYYDGRRVATQIEFYQPYQPYVEEGADGVVYGYDGSSINVDGVLYLIDPGCYVTGGFSANCRATVVYNHYNDGRRIATRIEFYQPYTPQVISVGEVSGAVYGFDGASINVEGMSCSLEPNCSVVGGFSPQCRATVRYNVYDNGAIKASSIEFHAFVGPVLPPEASAGEEHALGLIG